MDYTPSEEVKDWLNNRMQIVENNMSSFIEKDPVQIPKQFQQKEDIEIAAFLTAILSWGQRTTILKKANELMSLMDYSPCDFINNHKPKEREKFASFKHRTFQGEDALFFIERLQSLLQEFGTLEHVFDQKGENWRERIHYFKMLFFSVPHQRRTQKHLADPFKNSAAKRINMFLRWMVRDNLADIGCWTTFKKSELIIPLDVHSSRNGRTLELITTPKDNWLAANELTNNLKNYDPTDPVKYDYVLYGTGAFDFLPALQ